MEALGGIAAGIIIHRTGRYLELIYTGLVLLTIGNGLYILIDADSSLGKVIGFELIAGIGAGFVFEPPLIALQALVAQDNVATATATLGFIRNLSTSMSIVIGGVVLQNSMNQRSSQFAAQGLPANLVSEFAGRDAVANVNLISMISDPTQRLVVQQAFAWSLRNMWIMMTGIGACGVVASLFVGSSVLSKEHTETRTGIREKEKDRVPGEEGTIYE